MAERATVKVHLAVRNSASASLTVVLEPWGDQYVLAPDAAMSLAADGPAPGRLEVEVGSGRLLIYGWTGSVIEVDSEGDAGGGRGGDPAGDGA
jgi:hypothetical protein